MFNQHQDIHNSHNQIEDEHKVQSFGALLVIDSLTQIICQASQNIHNFLFETAQEIVNRNIHEFLPNFSTLYFNTHPKNEFLKLEHKEVTWMIKKGIVNICTRIHVQEKYVICELEWSSLAQQKTRAFEYINLMSKDISQIHHVSKLYAYFTKKLQEWLEYENVALLKYTEQNKIQKMADTFSAKQKNVYTQKYTFLNKIFQQGKDYWKIKNTRLIENLNETRIDLYPPISFINLSYTHIKQVSYYHTIKLKEINECCAWFCFSIFVNNHLWGMVWMQNTEPKYIGAEVRQIIEIVTNLFADRLFTLEKRKEEIILLKKQKILKNIKNKLINNLDLFETIKKSNNKILKLFDASGFAMYYENKWETIGNVPNFEFLSKITYFLSRYKIKQIYQTNSLTNLRAELKYESVKSAGLLAIEISCEAQEYMLWFRPENKKTPLLSNEWNEYNLQIAKYFFEELVHILYLKNKKIKKMNEDLADLFKKLKESDQKLKWMYNSSINANFLLDLEHKISWFNKSAENFVKDILGLQIKIGEKSTKYILPHQIKNFIENINRIKKGEILNFKLKLKTIDDERKIFSVMKFPVYNDRNELYAISIIFIDITETQRKREQLKDLATIVQNTDSMVMNLDTDLKITWVNDSFLRKYEYTFEECLGKTPTQLLQGLESDVAMLETIKKDLSKGKTIKTEILNYSKTGKKYWVLLTAQPIFDEKNKIIKYIGIEEDITEIKQKEEILQRAKLKAEEMNRLKTAFLANMSHEIRTPLNGILGLAQVMEQEDDIQEIKSMLKMQLQSGWRLLNTINDILKLSRLEAEGTSITLQKISISDLLQQLVPILKITAEQKGLALEYEFCNESLFCWADESILTQIFHNIIHNAIKFTPKGHVKIKTSIEENKILIEVEDTGIGIAPEFLSKIYDSFSQESQGMARTFEGIGLGLSIAKKYVQLLEGSIKVESEKGKGSKFMVSLPLREK